MNSAIFGNIFSTDAMRAVWSDEKDQLRPRVLVGEFSGAAGTLASLERGAMETPAISKHLKREELAKLCDPANNLGQSGIMADRVLRRVRPAA